MQVHMLLLTSDSLQVVVAGLNPDSTAKHSRTLTATTGHHA